MIIWTLIGIVCVVSILAGVLQGLWPARDPNAERFARLERKVSQIAKHLGTEQNQPPDQVQEMIVLGRKVSAIELYREQTGVGMVEAKEAVLSI